MPVEQHESDAAIARGPRTNYWLDSLGEAPPPRAPLASSRTVDVAILGGGFSGLWCAYYLLRARPDLEVAVLEAETCGFGASGRNGGWASGRYSVEADALERRVGAQSARATLLALQESVDEIQRICGEEGIDAQFRAAGILSLARGPAQRPLLDAAWKSYERLGLHHQLRLLSAEEARERVRAARICGGLLSSVGASLHPGRLVRGLACAVERRGGNIYEHSPVRQLRLGREAALCTDAGSLSARLAVVAAGEAYLSQLREFRRRLLPVASSLVVTEPLTAGQWRSIGWDRGECLNSQSRLRNYLTRTADGRILYGSRGIPYRLGSRMDDASLRDSRVTAQLKRSLCEWFPALESVRFSHAWGGYLGISRDWMPSVHFDRDARVAQLSGYAGRGVATSNLAARLLAGLLLQQPSGLESLPLHRHAARRWEIEPLRWLGTRYLQGAYARMDAREDAGQGLPLDASIAQYLGGG